MNRASNHWQTIFEQWPEGMQRRGLIVTTFQETISFVDYRLSQGVLLLERDRPDPHGARKVMLTWDGIAALKLVDPGDLSTYESMGFAANN
jgi:hypothetical protein